MAERAGVQQIKFSNLWTDEARDREIIDKSMTMFLSSNQDMNKIQILHLRLHSDDAQWNQ